jgi:multicomponent Na+:H+ antiporter subunit D
MNSGVITAILVMMFVGLGIEGELFPFNGWSPDVYSGAPYPVAVLFSGVTVKAALYVFVRFFFTIANSQMLSLILAVGVATLFVSEFAALKQKDVKRMLGYSSLGQLGLIVIAFGTATSLSVQGAMFHFVNHAILKGVLFLTLGYFVEQTNSPLIENLKGIGRKKPFAGVMFGLAALAVIGMPPFNGFMSKLMILSALAKNGSFVLIGAILFASVVEGIYYFRVLQVIFAKQEEVQLNKVEGAYFYYVPVMVLSVLIIAIGLHPGLITQYLPKVTQELLDKSVYIKGMIGGAL